MIFAMLTENSCHYSVDAYSVKWNLEKLTIHFSSNNKTTEVLSSWICTVLEISWQYLGNNHKWLGQSTLFMSSIMSVETFHIFEMILSYAKILQSTKFKSDIKNWFSESPTWLTAVAHRKFSGKKKSWVDITKYT